MHTCRTLLRPYGVWRLLALAFEDDLRISHYQTQVQMSPALPQVWACRGVTNTLDGSKSLLYYTIAVGFAGFASPFRREC